MNIDKGLTGEQASTVFDELQPGDRIEVELGLILDSEEVLKRTTGTVLRTEHSSHPCRAGSLVGDLILMELLDGDLVVVTIGESTVVRRA